MDSIVKSIDYSVERTPDGEIELTVEVESIRFKREIIPDGQLAGMLGHREVPHTATYSWQLHPAQARMLCEQLGQLINSEGG